MTKRTPLFEEHQKLNARFTEFGGWEMPVQYSSIMEEHTAVRTKAGLFDTSHMGIVFISGPGATAFLDKLTTANAGAIVEGQAKYAMFLNEQGGVIDDLIIYRRKDDYLLIINAGNTDKDLAWLTKNLPSDVTMKNTGSNLCLLALQGPDSEKILQPLVKESLAGLKYFRFMNVTLMPFSPFFVIVARTGYTGEDGFEIIISKDSAVPMWNLLVRGGAKPAGLGARDTLRLEAGMPLHGHEISDDISPLEAGLGWPIYWDKEFIGKEALLKQKKEGVKRHLTAFMMDAGVPRAHCEIVINGKPAGMIVSGTYSPTLKKGIALGYTDTPLKEGDHASIVVHGQPRDAVVVKSPFYKRKK